MREVDRFIRNKIEEGYFPGCVIFVGNGNETVFHEAYGYSQLVPEKRKMRRNSIFDIASITKPVATATSILLLVELKKIEMDTPVGNFLPEIRGTVNEDKTIGELLTHTSGIPAWYPLYLHSCDEKSIIKFIGDMEGEKPVYSCLDYILLGKVVERVTGKTLKEFSENNIFKPLSMKDTMFCPPKKLWGRVAATEVGNKHERNLSKKYNKKTFSRWREKTIIGEVHDGNSYYCFDGISGNAGLFSTASDLAIFARTVLKGGNDTIKPKIVQYLVEKRVRTGDEKRSLGFVIGGDDLNGLSQKTIWHSGFTGCVLWIDVEKQIFIIFLSNGVHPDVQPNIITSIRPDIVNHCLQLL
jgi:CubicO group peptidase (beta-lactamase class C family)